jgi:conjugal transfer pilus assembly protein TraF
MALQHHDPKAVEAVQYYMRWMLQRASEAANLWYYNMVQNPELDPQAQKPISAFGLKLMTTVDAKHAAGIYKALRDQGAMLVFFSRSDCSFCHSMAPLAQHVAKDTGLTLWDASLDDQCIPGMEKHCRTKDAALRPAEALQVKKVPTLFLYVPSNTWIRVANGVSDVQTMEARIVSFFSAYRTALLKSVHNGQGVKPSVDFSDTPAVSGVATGAPAGKAHLPSDAEVRRLLAK